VATPGSGRSWFNLTKKSYFIKGRNCAVNLKKNQSKEGICMYF
jgi:hypothetical protein